MATVLNPNAGEDEPLRINLEEDATAGSVVVAPAVAEPAPSPAPAAGIDELARQLSETRRNREQWVQHARQKEQEAQQHAAIATQAQERGILVEEVLNETRLKSVTDQLESLRETQQGAYESGDWGKVAGTNVKMADLGGQKAVLEQQQQWLASQRQQHVAQQQYNQQQREQAAATAAAAPTDPVEATLAKRTPRTQAFLRQHPELMRSDGSFTRAAVDAHERAMDEKLKVDTDDYFRRVEEILGSGGGGETRQRQVKDTSARPKGAPTTAAPVSRGGNVPGQISGSEFVMTPHMRELAEEQGVEPAEWAAQYVRLVREGRIEPIE